MKDVKEFHHMLNDLCSISDCPNFSDRMRDNAMNLLYYIKDYKPEPPEPLIVESGNTYVAYWEGVDYLCVHPKRWQGVPKDLYSDIFKQQLYKRKGTWKSFTGDNPDITELTDEIIKLRPVCKFTEGTQTTTAQVVFKQSSDIQYLNHLGHYWENCRLATAQELREYSKCLIKIQSLWKK